MAKVDENGKEIVTIEELRCKLRESVESIKNIKGSKQDVNDFSTEEKGKLRVEYNRAAWYCKQIAERTTDDAEKQQCEKNAKVLSDRAVSFGSIVSAKIPTTTFDDVKGLEEVKKLIKSFMYMAEHPQIVSYYNLSGGLGMMMYGAPGTGKTMFAEAIANAMKLPLFIVTPADIFKSYVGESEAAVKMLFQEIDACPDGAILFVDECESIFSRRTSDTKDYKSAVTTELLQRINGFGINGSKRILIGATNRPDQIDPAYLRYKRFSHLIHITPPDLVTIKALVEGKLNIDKKDKKPIELDDITVDGIVEMIDDSTYEVITDAENKVLKRVQLGMYSAADVCGIIEEACRIALEELQKANASKPIPLTRKMFSTALKKFKPSITTKLLKEYENFNKQTTLAG